MQDHRPAFMMPLPCSSQLGGVSGLAARVLQAVNVYLKGVPAVLTGHMVLTPDDIVSNCAQKVRQWFKSQAAKAGKIGLQVQAEVITSVVSPGIEQNPFGAAKDQICRGKFCT